MVDLFLRHAAQIAHDNVMHAVFSGVQWKHYNQVERLNGKFIDFR